MPRILKPKSERVYRGSWGSGSNVHGNNIHLLPVTLMLNRLSKSLPSTRGLALVKNKFPEWINNTGITYEGEKYLARLRKIGLDKAIEFMG